MRLPRGFFATDLFSLYKPGFFTIASNLKSSLRNFIRGVVIVIDQGNLHIKDIDLKFASTWELALLSKSTESHLNKAVDFIRGLTF